jgi:hypothetical protein
MTAKRRLIARCATFLGVIWIIACVPLASVVYEFGGIECGNASLGWFIATLYGSFFIYPLAVGGLSMAAFVLPLATFVSLLKSRSAIVLLTFYAVTTAIVCFLEFNWSSDALFQVIPDKITGNAVFLSGLRMACNGQKFVAYKDQLPALLAQGRSYTGWVYYPGFIAQALMQNALFVVFIAFIYHRKSMIVRKSPYLKRAIFFVLGYAVFLGSIWCLFRLSYRNDMPRLLGVTNPLGGDYAIIALYAIVLAVFVAYFEFNMERLAKTIAQIGQFLVFVGGAAFVHFDASGTFFGAGAAVVNIVTLVLLFLFISALTLAFLLQSQRS